MNSTQDTNNVGLESIAMIEECPPPPYYYKLFQNNLQSEILPPTIPDDSFIEANSHLRYLTDFNTAKSDHVIDLPEVKRNLQRILHDILQCGLNLTSDISSSISTKTSYMIKMNESITEFHNILNSYRDHETREYLLISLKNQLGRAKELEKTLETLCNLT